MRHRFTDVVEKGRMLEGSMPSLPGSLCGAFIVKCPVTKARLKVITSDAKDWTECGLKGRPFEHVSVSVIDARPPSPTRCPTWEEMAWVKEQFWYDDETVMQLHPPKVTRVDCHPSVLHLWRPADYEIPLPDPKAV